MLVIEKDKYHIRVCWGEAKYSIPIEVVRGIKNGELPDDKYQDAAMFLSLECRVPIFKENIKEILEKNV